MHTPAYRGMVRAYMVRPGARPPGRTRRGTLLPVHRRTPPRKGVGAHSGGRGVATGPMGGGRWRS
ncbi:hypothetical protein ACIQZN_11580 [Streptomyces sp. NPDC097595]|uniref:hypothetical protein n=1 Tax=Streptomyces sp. NPDC097595 TaxID=3366090 RepID=UPI00381C641B